MRCSGCGSDNPETNRFCGQCGSALDAPERAYAEPVDTVVFPGGPVSSAFREEVERQQSQLREYQRRAEDRGLGGSSSLGDLRRRATDRKPEQVSHRDRASYGDAAEAFGDVGADRGSARHREDAIPLLETPSTITSTQISEERSSSDAGEPAAVYRDPISGPSFLGLGEPERDASANLAYLYEDEPRSGRARYLIAALIVLACAAFLFYQWKQNWNWDTTIIGRHRGQQADAGSPTGEPTAKAEQGTEQPKSARDGPGATAAIPSSNETEKATTGDTSTAPAAQSDEANGTGSDTLTAEEAPGKSPASPNSADPDSFSNGGNRSGSVTAQGRASEPDTDQATADSASEPGTSEQRADASVGDEGDASESAEPASPSSSRPASRSAAPLERDPDADMVARAERYLYGRGVRKNCDQALVYLRIAANRGSATARSKLGGLYATGNCVPMDRAEAYNWFTLAREAGSKSMWVERNREMLWSQMTQAERERTLGP